MFNARSVSFEEWQHATCQNFSITETRRIGRGSFAGSLVARPFGSLTITKVSSSFDGSQIKVERKPRQVRLDQRDQFMVFLVHRGDIGFTQNGRTARLGRGDMLVFDQARPFAMELGGKTRKIVVSIPRPLILSHLRDTDAYAACTIRSSTKLGSLSASIFGQLAGFDTQLDDALARRVGGSAIDILVAALQSQSLVDTNNSGTHNLRLERIKRYIVTNLHDPGTTADTIASAKNIAPRTLYRLFANEGTTPTRWLWEQRLLASYKALAERRVRNITDAALSCGFTDLAHFSRSFKQKFGHAPRELMRR